MKQECFKCGLAAPNAVAIGEYKGQNGFVLNVDLESIFLRAHMMTRLLTTMLNIIDPACASM